MIRFDTKKDMEHYDNLYHKIIELQQENKELKEVVKTYNEDTHKLTERYLQEMESLFCTLEKWVEEESNKTIINVGILQTWLLVENKIQELKKRYLLGDKENE